VASGGFGKFPGGFKEELLRLPWVNAVLVNEGQFVSRDVGKWDEHYCSLFIHAALMEIEISLSKVLKEG